jgi:tetratricopeptide (TPR) repeat protein
MKVCQSERPGRTPVVAVLAAGALALLAAASPATAAAPAAPAAGQPSAVRVADRPAPDAALRQGSTASRLAAIDALARRGTARDAARVMPLLHDPDPLIRQRAETAAWVLWGRSGDPATDAAYRRGVAQMESGDLDAAIATFGAIVARRPAFAEAWNKRATALFFAGRLDESLADCDEVIRRVPDHFGALAGYGQIWLRKDEPERVVEYWERALGVNPNLESIAQAIEFVRREAAARGRSRI